MAEIVETRISWSTSRTLGLSGGRHVVGWCICKLSGVGHIQSRLEQVSVFWSCNHHGLQPDEIFREFMLHSMALLLAGKHIGNECVYLFD